MQNVLRVEPAGDRCHSHHKGRLSPFEVNIQSIVYIMKYTTIPDGDQSPRQFSWFCSQDGHAESTTWMKSPNFQILLQLNENPIFSICLIETQKCLWEKSRILFNYNPKEYFNLAILQQVALIVHGDFGLLSPSIPSPIMELGPSSKSCYHNIEGWKLACRSGDSFGVGRVPGQHKADTVVRNGSNFLGTPKWMR